MALHFLGLNYPPTEGPYGFLRPLSDLLYATQGHLTGIAPLQATTRASHTAPDTLVHPPWVPPGSPKPSSKPSPRSLHASHALSGAELTAQLLALAQSLSAEAPLLPPPAASPLRSSLSSSAHLAGSSSSSRLHAASPTALQRSQPPPPSPRGLFSTTATLTLPSPDPFLLPPLPQPLPALAQLRLHLCPSQALLRALATAARSSSGFLTEAAFIAAVGAWDGAAAPPPPASPAASLLSSLFSLAAREAQPTSRSWHHGHASLDFRLLAAALLPALTLTPPAARLELLWSLYDPQGLSIKQLAGAAAAVGAGRVALALCAAASGSAAQEDCWRVRGTIQRHARALAAAAFEDSKVTGRVLSARAMQQWLELRRVSLF